MATGDRRESLLGAMLALGLAVYATATARHRQALAQTEHGRGRSADQPSDIPAPGWRDIGKRVLTDISRDNISLMAAGIAFYGILSIAPGLTGIVSLYGLAFDPKDVETQVSALSSIVPQEALDLISSQLKAIVSANPSRLGVGLIVSLLLSLWSANSGTSSLMTALNVAYGEEEKRSLLGYYARSLLLTAGLLLVGILAIVLVAIIPAVLGFLPFGGFGQTLVSWVRWPVLVAVSAIVIGAIYRYGPSRAKARWRWVSWGALAATLLWIIGSALFSFYVGEFASYDKTYGSLGAVVVLLMWLWVSAFAVLLGAELDSEMELQTAQDTTTPPRKPIGKRGAFVADTVAPSP